MTNESLFALLLCVQGLIGGIDTVVNHELIARLPRHIEARTEVGLHAIREAIYMSLFAGIAWFAWHGIGALIIGTFLVSELIVTIYDEYVENHTRVLPQNERILHIFLTLNLGLLFAVAIPLLRDWNSLPSAITFVSHGVLSWLLSIFAILGAIWSIRDLCAWRHLRSVEKNTQ